MLKDAQGLEVTTVSLAAVTAVNHFVDELLSIGKDALVILKAVEADPTWSFAHALAAAIYLFAGNSDALVLALPHLDIANQHLAQANEREQLFVNAVAAWARRDGQQAIAYHRIISDRYPRDLASVYICQYHQRNIGDSQGLLEIAEQVFGANLENPYMYGILSFGLEECHRLAEAEETGRRAVAMKRNHPWAHHAVAHVLETQGRLQEGIAWMESVADTWENVSPILVVICGGIQHYII